MLATTTTDTLGIIETALLRKNPSSIPACLDLIANPIASSWSSDNIHLFIASPRTIYKYNSSSNTIRGVYDVEGSESIRSLVTKGKDVIFSLDHIIAIHQFHNADSHTLQTFVCHNTPVTSLALSNDNSLLASAAPGVVYVHNLATGSHTPLRGLGPPGPTGVAFHIHSRTRLLVFLARQVQVYDALRPSSPLKTILLSDSSAGDITALSCSPFSKTLVAVATSLGFVGIIDLEKEKAQIRSVNIKATPTAIEFSQEGGAIYIGTDDGKLLVVDLRNLDKTPKLIMVSEIGDPIRTLSIQKKIKIDALVKTPKKEAMNKTPSELLPNIRRTVSSTAVVTKLSNAGSPIQRAPVSSSSATSRRLASSSAPSPTSLKGTTSQPKKVLSPVKDPLGNTNDVQDLQHESKRQVGTADNLGNSVRIQPKNTATTPRNEKRELKDSLKPRASSTLRTSTRNAQPSTKATLESKGIRRSRTLPISKSTAITPAEPKDVVLRSGQPTTKHLHVPRGNQPRRVTPSASAVSSPSRQSSGLSSTAPSRLSSPTSRPCSHKSSSEDTRKKASPATKPSIPMVSVELADCRTPSPALPDLSAPLTPQIKKSAGMKVLGLGTPEVERWINSEKGEDCEGSKTKGVSKDICFNDHEGDAETIEGLMERARKLSLQISPRRPVPSTSSSTVDSLAAQVINSPALSQTSYPAGTHGPPNPPTVSSAQDLLKTIIQDVVFDFQRETKAEMMGLHLDLLRMGRSWKAELRSLMDEYVGDLREMREENERLRKENERLRRDWH